MTETNVETLETPTVEETSTEEVVKTDKVFSQDQVNKLVQERIQREKVASKKVQEEIVAERDSLKSAVESYEKFISKFVEDMKKDIPENYKPLFTKLSLIEQYEFLTDPKNKVAEKKQIPATPNPVEHKENIEKKFRRLF
jgi:hypothetical protein